MKNSEGKPTIEIEGVILTPEAIHRLTILQGMDNEELNIGMESIVNAICWIASQMYLLNEDNLRKAAVACGDLALVRDTINQLRKP